MPEEIRLSSSAIAKTLASPGVDYRRTEGADGKSAWFVDENGVKTIDRKGHLQDLMSERAVLCNELTPIEEPAGKGFFAFTAGGLVVSAGVDGNGRIVYAVLPSTIGSAHEIRITEYGTLPNGHTYPSAWTVDGGAPLTVTRAVIDDHSIIEPRTVAWATSITPGNGSVPMMLRSGRFVVPCTFDDRNVSCILDTGSGGLLASADVAKFEPGTISDFALNAWEGRRSAHRGRVQSLRLAGTVFTKPVVTEDDQLPSDTVVVGLDYFQTNRVRLIFAPQPELVNESQPTTCVMGCVSISVWQVPIGTVTIDERRFTMLFDTGSAVPVKVPPAFVTPAAFAGGCRDGRLAKISLGSLTTEAQLCPLPDRTGYPFSVGAPVFAKYREVVIDYPNNRLQFVK